MLSELSFRPGGEFSGGFLKLGAEGLEYLQLSIVLLYAFACEPIG
jgi:hypothetical protein